MSMLHLANYLVCSSFNWCIQNI